VTRKIEEHPGDDREAFLSRWSRKKTELREVPQKANTEKSADPNAPAPELPPIDKLTFESDYSGFLHPKVDEDTRRAALKKLFSDPHFSAIDMMDVYIDDYSKPDPIPAAMLAGLRQAQNILARAKEMDEESAREEAAENRKAQALEPPAPESSSGTGSDGNAPEPSSAHGDPGGTSKT